MMDTGDKIVFHIAGLTKTKRPNKPHLSFIFHAYTDDETLDVIQCLHEYLQRTEAMRNSEAEKQKLFLAYIKSHKPVITCSIARWLRTVMSIAGIDTSNFKAHSTRAASTSKAIIKGLSTQQIVKCANWTRASTFNKYYRKLVAQSVQSTYQRTVMTL